MAGIWVRLRKRVPGDVGERNLMKKRGWRSGKRSKASNPFAASGLEKFATLLEGIQATRSGASLVERTASSLSAARSISRSAQEWTAAMLASRRGSESGSVLQCEAFNALAPMSTPPLAVTAIVGDSESKKLSSVKNLSEEKCFNEERRRSSGVWLPERPSRCRIVTKVRSARRQGWKQTSKSAFVVLVAMSSFICSRFGKAGKQLAALLTFSAVIDQLWRKGKASTWFTVSSIAVYSPLRSYVVTRMPCNSKVNNISPPTNATSIRNFEVDATVNERNFGLGSSLSSASSSQDYDEFPIPETESAGPGIGQSLPDVVVDIRKSSISRRLAKRISSRFKKLNMFRADSSSAHHPDAKSETPPSSSSDRRRTCPFSRRLHKSHSSDFVTENDESTSSRKGILCKKSSKLLSSESLENHNLQGPESMPSSASSSLHGKAKCIPSSASTSTSPKVEVHDFINSANASARTSNFSWRVVGLLVILLLLLVGRFPAIMATSLFFVVVSNAEHDGSHSRGRDNRALQAARKLHRSPPSRGQR